MQFDKKTLIEWKNAGIKEVSCTLVSKGCAGIKLEVTIGKNEGNTTEEIYDDLTLFFRPDDYGYLADATVTRVGEKWLVKGKNILLHCGCGTSFRMKGGDPLRDKLETLKMKLRNKNGISHK